MQLRVARLCMDCEELHDQQQCPVCASESFAYVSRWVPVRERRFQPRAPTTPAAAAPSPGTSKTRTATYGVMGLALAGAAGWWLKSRKKLEAVAERGAGELK
jgi:LPXTG-motif cell wall-anchored protein